MAADKRDSSKQSSSNRAGLPFEPKGSKKSVGKPEREKPASKKEKAAKKKQEKAAVSPQAQARVEEIRAMRQRRAEKNAQKNERTPRKGSADSEIPKEVSQRMLRRMAFFSGMPVALGVGVFFLSYYLQSREIVELAPVVVLLLTMGCFGLGVLGLTYGVLSASWDEEPGGLVGIKEFKLNFGRAVESWKEGKAAKG